MVEDSNSRQPAAASRMALMGMPKGPVSIAAPYDISSHPEIGGSEPRGLQPSGAKYCEAGCGRRISQHRRMCFECHISHCEAELKARDVVGPEGRPYTREELAAALLDG